MVDVQFVPNPPSALVRVSKQPSLLRRWPMEEFDPAAMSRFDDPDRNFLVRYLATRLRGCLVETMARFRPAPAVESILAALDGVEPGDYDPTREDGLLDWLSQMTVGYCTITDAEVRILDVDRAESLIALDKHPRVRHALDQSGLGNAVNPARPGWGGDPAVWTRRATDHSGGVLTRGARDVPRSAWVGLHIADR